MAGLRNKDRAFWRNLADWDVMVCETWLDKKGWEKVRDYMPKGYRWKMQWAGKRKSYRKDDIGSEGRNSSRKREQSKE